jgi:CRISPR/Cas system CMR subunit Cmr6 (Cas7 group RAMP superfamily)
MIELNPDGMFADSLKELAQLEVIAKQKATLIDEQISALKEQKSAVLQPVADIKSDLEEQIKAIFASAGDNEELQKTIKGNMHHLITFRTTKEFTFNEELARNHIIENKIWDMIRKPTIAKSAIKKAWKAHNAKWLIDASEETKISVSIGKLGELLTTAT